MPTATPTQPTGNAAKRSTVPSVPEQQASVCAVPQKPTNTHNTSHRTALAACFAPNINGNRFPNDATAWHNLAREADKRGLCGLVLERANACGVNIPNDARSALQTGTARVAAQQLHMTHELSKLLAAFNDAGVPVMLLKGAALTLCLYDEAGLRPMSDVDLLVRPADVARAATVLRQAGCRRGAELVRDDFFPRFYYETEWVTGSDRPVRLDFHARPLRPLRIAITMPDDALWLDARQVNVCGAPAWIPSPEAMFVHLAAHAAYHGCSRLIWLYDLRRFYERNGDAIDWSIVLELCQRWRLSTPVRYAIEQCQKRVGDICPDDVARSLHRHRISWRDRLVLWQAPRDGERPLRHVFINAITTPDLRHAAAYVFACFRPNDAHLGAIYRPRHPGWRICAHLIRGLRAAARAAGGLIPLRTAGKVPHRAAATGSN